ncbi:hypothetical protein [Microbulbifer sp. TYP-18]|uniref:hypothetical protein n=1 Tax=Microbulbifer sp. TYP-18 TaxID=3230024 RepID=UPI0034C6472A
MKKLFTAVSLAIVTGFTGAANAETWSTDVALEDVAPLTVTKGITLLCNMTGSATLAGSNASITSLGLSDASGTCQMIGFFNFPYNMEGGASDVVTIEGVDVQGITGNCLGDLVGTLNQTTGVISFVNANIPSNPAGGSPCIINGDVKTTPPASYTP